MPNRRDILIGLGGTAALPSWAIGRAVSNGISYPGTAPSGLLTDLRHRPAGIEPGASRLSWIQPSTAHGIQLAYQVQAAASPAHLHAGHPNLDTGRVVGDLSTGVTLSHPIVEEGRHIVWRVRTWDAQNRASSWSTPQRVIGAAPRRWQATPIWASESRGLVRWLLARTEFEVPNDMEAVWMYATATSPEPARQYVARLMLNGHVVGLGPVRSHDAKGEARYSTIDLTDTIKPGRNAIAALCYAAEGRCFQAELRIARRNGDHIVIATGADWRVMSGDRWRPPAGFTGGGWYEAPQEYIDARHEPVGWESPGFDDRDWATPETRSLMLNLAPERVDGITYRDIAARGTLLSPGRWLFDLGREIVGGIRLDVDGIAGRTVEVRLGEERAEDGGARYELRAKQTYREIWTLRDGPQRLEHWGYRGFRWIELIADPALDLSRAVTARQLAMPWSNADSGFESSDTELDRVWDMCRYSIEALRLDVYQDTPTRERGPYEGDAIINQLSEFSVQRSYDLSRYSTGYLARRPTWPTEYRMQTPILAWRDYMATGDPGVLTANYDAMCARLRLDRLNADGLVEKDPGASSIAEGDLVDWPIANRDGYVFNRVNTVVNAWQYASLIAMADVAGALGRTDDRTRFAGLASRLRTALNSACLGADGTYVDGIGTAHRSQHATAFAVALGIIPDTHRTAAGRALASQGMRMSVYGAQFLLEALFLSGQSAAARALMTSHQPSSWLAMMDDQHATIAMEAWSPALKPNTTFSHAWGTAPANIVQRFIAGVSVIAPGAATLQVQPDPASLSYFHSRVPTIRGPVQVAYTSRSRHRLKVSLPANTVANIVISPEVVAENEQMRVWDASGRVVATHRDQLRGIPGGTSISVEIVK